MKVIVAGTRTFDDSQAVGQAIFDSGFEVTEVVSGCCKGPDKLGEEWAKKCNIPVKKFPANFFQFGKTAGPKRNKDMADYADALVALWDGISPGTRNMIWHAKNKKLKLFVVKV